MISWRTIFSLLLTVIVLLGIRAWAIDHGDACDRYMSGDRTVPASEYVESGTRTLEVRCDSWFPRQRLGVQLACLVDFALMVVFGLSVWSDVSRRRNRGRERSAMDAQ